MPMLRALMLRPVVALMVMCLAAGAAEAAAGCHGRAGAAHPHTEAADRPLFAGLLRLTEGPSGNRGCAENCVAQCRQAQSSCSGDAASCRAAFQICARRCVVSCGTSR
jgi:hypothetical protein